LAFIRYARANQIGSSPCLRFCLYPLPRMVLV